MMGYYGSGMPGWMWVVDVLFTIVFWGGLAALVVFAVRALGRRQDRGESADEILRRRLAAGQISQEEYERTRQTLNG